MLNNNIYWTIFFKQTWYIYSPKFVEQQYQINKKNIHTVYINIKRNEQNDRTEHLISIRTVLSSLSSVSNLNIYNRNK